MVARMTMPWPVRCVLAENHVYIPMSNLSPDTEIGQTNTLQALVGDKESSAIQGSGNHQRNSVLQKQPSNGRSLHFNRLPSFHGCHGSLKFGCIVDFQINFCNHSIQKDLQKNIDLSKLQPILQLTIRE